VIGSIVTLTQGVGLPKINEKEKMKNWEQHEFRKNFFDLQKKHRNISLNLCINF
jgi:hypothetical protein